MAGYLGSSAVFLSTTAVDIDGDNNVGGNLVVGGTATAADLFLEDTSPRITLTDSDGTDQWTHIQEAAGNTVYISNNDATKGQHIWQQVASGVYTEAMRINTSGNVQITETVTAKNFIGSGTNPTITSIDADGYLAISGDSTAGTGANFRLFSATHATNANNIIFRDNAVEALRYDSSASLWNFQASDITTTGVVTATSVSSGALVAGTATYGGTADVITITTGLSLTALTTGMEIRFRATAANTGATTINVDAIGAVAALTVTSAALPATYIRTDVDTVIRYNGTNWIADRQIERGSNANGQYVKWADGTLINTESYGTSNAGTIGGWGTLTFAHAFVSAPTGFGCLVRAATSGSPKPYVYFHTNPSATQYFPLIADSGTFTTGYFTVTGLWY